MQIYHISTTAVLLHLFLTLFNVLLYFFYSSLLQRAVDGELDPEDDPNNQGEDEFEEAEDERLQHRVTQEEEEAEEEVEEEPAAPAQHVDTHQGPNQPAVEEELVVSKGPENSNSQIQRSYI